jgi:hypothetical protein
VGTPAAVKVGPGLIYVAPIGTSEPTTVSAALPSAWTAIGYTESGSTFSSTTTFDDIEVAEELDPIRTVASKRITTFKFEMAEINAQNWSVAFNGGTIGSPTSGYVTFEPPALGAEQRLMLVWSSDDAQERLLCRRVLQVGSVETARQKSPNKALIPAEFRLEVPLDGSKIFKLWEPSALATDDAHT